ncbi:hypothetical protein LCGC14_2107710 [marine sediment metagenome]|uniref:Uncharacterized protein n=1 Tax=marine sediment metagenome TaxID=412755 RepID=A0A0F9EV80_9ZZZZ
MPKWRHEQTLEDFKIGDRVAWTYFRTSWNLELLIGTVVGFTKYQVRIEFEPNRFGLERKTLPPTVLTETSYA